MKIFRKFIKSLYKRLWKEEWIESERLRAESWKLCGCDRVIIDEEIASSRHYSWDYENLKNTFVRAILL
jgi:hypothetical protein